MIVGLTGAIGAGKSTVARLLAERGAIVVDTDAIARAVVEPPSPLLDSIARIFGPEMIGPGGRLDRARLARKVFADDEQRRRLNELFHPEILKRTLAEIGRHPSSAIVVVVVPLLFESDFERNCQVTVAVVASADARRRRVLERGGITEEDAAARMRTQLPDDEYARRAQIVIANEGDFQALEREVSAAWQKILNM